MAAKYCPCHLRHTSASLSVDILGRKVAPVSHFAFLTFLPLFLLPSLHNYPSLNLSLPPVKSDASLLSLSSSSSSRRMHSHPISRPGTILVFDKIHMHIYLVSKVGQMKPIAFEEFLDFIRF